MKNLKLTMMGGLCALVGVLVCARVSGVEEADGCGKEVDACGACKVPAGNDGAAGALEKRVAVPCEHKMPIYQCNECRYEAGVVKLDACLMRNAAGAGVVQTQVLARAKVTDVLAATGEVSLNENTTVHISSRIAGVIEAVNTDVGKRVQAGDVLLTLASVELGRALADYGRNQALAELSEKVYARENKLREQKVGSDQDVINAQVALEQNRAELKASRQMLQVLGLTEADLAKTGAAAQAGNKGILPVYAPAAGAIIEKHAVAGETLVAGKDLMLLADLTNVWVWINVYAQDLEPLLAAEKRGRVDVEIKVGAFPGKVFKGVLDYVGATMSEQTRTVKVRATIDNSGLLLRPGMFCDAAIALGSEKAEEVLAAPSGAVLADDGKTFVFKYWKEDYYIRQDVRKGREFSGMVEILEGLQSGETVVTEGAFLLKSDVLREKMGAGCAD